ncbi:MAG: hypothetical protein M1828_003867 [Chrysothrix sp. TS-e1954]|nr:MAG: hypothetical protein M1828_003867 [Chrysothrix sp. TS-e1954]
MATMQSFRVLDLPPEIRFMIYEHALFQEERDETMWISSDNGRSFAPRVFDSLQSSDKNHSVMFDWSPDGAQNLDTYTKLCLLCHQVKYEMRRYLESKLDIPKLNIEYKLNIWAHHLQHQLSWTRQPFPQCHCQDLTINIQMLSHHNPDGAYADNTGLIVPQGHLLSLVNALSNTTLFMRMVRGKPSPLRHLTLVLSRPTERDWSMTRAFTRKRARLCSKGVSPVGMTASYKKCKPLSQKKLAQIKSTHGIEAAFCNDRREVEDQKHEYFDEIVYRSANYEFLPESLRIVMPFLGFEWKNEELRELHDEWTLPDFADDPALWGWEVGDPPMRTWGYP